jgi:hypothetical protein
MAIIDAEIVVCDGDGKPDFNALMEGGAGHLCAWCFDLLELNGQKERKRPLIDRKVMLRHLLIKADDDVLRYSEEFPNAEKLLAVATKQGLEGIVSKKAIQPYVSGKNVGWIMLAGSCFNAPGSVDACRRIAPDLRVQRNDNPQAVWQLSPLIYTASWRDLDWPQPIRKAR